VLCSDKIFLLIPGVALVHKEKRETKPYAVRQAHRKGAALSSQILQTEKCLDRDSTMKPLDEERQKAKMLQSLSDREP
jgi:hypothetical protein